MKVFERFSGLLSQLKGHGLGAEAKSYDLDPEDGTLHLLPPQLEDNGKTLKMRGVNLHPFGGRQETVVSLRITEDLGVNLLGIRSDSSYPFLLNEGTKIAILTEAANHMMVFAAQGQIGEQIEQAIA